MRYYRGGNQALCELPAYAERSGRALQVFHMADSYAFLDMQHRE